MGKFVLSPNLPHKAELVLIGEKYVSDLQVPLQEFGVRLISMPANPRVDPRLSSHADLSLIHIGAGDLLLTDYLKSTYLANLLYKTGFSVEFCAPNQGKSYPLDAQINICCVGNYYIHNPKVSDQAIISRLEKQGRVGISCRQGYCKCSVCIVDENSVICADKGISAACKAVGIDVLEIQPGFIELDGFDYGFIGGASFKLSSDILAFTGSLAGHPDKHRIFDFLELCGVTPVFLTDKPIFDIGSAVILTEQEPEN